MKKTDRLYISYYMDKNTLPTEEGTNNKYFSIERKKGRVALMCPTCNRMSYFNIDCTNKTTSIGNTDGESLISQTYMKYCDFCDYTIYSVNAIDGGIAEAVEILNKKGYKTLSSCEGHYDNKYGVTSLPYILFDDRHIKEDIVSNFNDINIYPWSISSNRYRRLFKPSENTNKIIESSEAITELFISEELVTPDFIKLGAYLDKLLNIVDRLRLID